jgi:hypothetical protein
MASKVERWHARRDYREHEGSVSMKRAIAICLATAGLSLLAASTAAATPPHVGCPTAASGYGAWPVSTEPYQADNSVDLNGNGWVCARPVDDQTFTVGGVTYQVYNFIDDVTPA